MRSQGKLGKRDAKLDCQIECVKWPLMWDTIFSWMSRAKPCLLESFKRAISLKTHKSQWEMWQIPNQTRNLAGVYINTNVIFQKGWGNSPYLTSKGSFTCMISEAEFALIVCLISNYMSTFIMQFYKINNIFLFS